MTSPRPEDVPMRRLIPCSLAATLVICLSGVDSPDATKAAAEVAAIRAMLDRQMDDWNKKDLDAFCAGYWNSPKLVFLSGGDRSDGWEAMRARYRKNYQGEGKEMGKLAFTEVEVEPLSADSAFARGRWELTKSDGSHPSGLYTLILKKFPEGWRIIHDHTSIATK
jgi:ketosteroid isomerase-like protein